MHIPHTLLADIAQLARAAGEAILAIYQHPKYVDLVKIQFKADQSPVTQADQIAHDIIVTGLTKLNKQYNLSAYIVSEEDDHTHQVTAQINRLNFKAIWLVDPLDGTKEFIARTNEFTVNIALIYAHQPILGVIYVPCYDLLYSAQQGKGAFLQIPEQSIPTQLILNKNKADKSNQNLLSNQTIRVLSSRRHGVLALDKVLSKLTSQKCNYSIDYLGSSWKFGKIAEGKADLYPRLGPTSEWDTAAGQIILAEAGGEIRDLSGKLFSYNTKNNVNNSHFIAVSQPDLCKIICG